MADNHILKLTAAQLDESLEKAQILSNPNLLDNWYFGNPVNQRGQTEYVGRGYGIDRWNTLSGYISYRLTNEGLSVSKGESNQYESIHQIVPVAPWLAGKTCTVSIKAKAPGNIAIRVYANSTSGSQLATLLTKCADGVVSATFTVPSGIEKLLMLIYTHYYAGASSTDTILEAAKLELGSSQTLAHQENGVWVLNEIPNFSQQLLRCCMSTADPADEYANNNKTHEAVGAAGVEDVRQLSEEIGDIDTALDAIIAMQNAYIGGEGA